MNDDPLIAHETQPTPTFAEMVRANDRLGKGFPLITLSVLMLHGTSYQATKPSGHQRFTIWPIARQALQLYEGHFHDLRNDTDKEMVIPRSLTGISSIAVDAG
jgi:acylglycerol lipase